MLRRILLLAGELLRDATDFSNKTLSKAVLNYLVILAFIGLAVSYSDSFGGILLRFPAMLWSSGVSQEHCTSPKWLSRREVPDSVASSTAGTSGDGLIDHAGALNSQPRLTQEIPDPCVHGTNASLFSHDIELSENPPENPSRPPAEISAHDGGVHPTQQPIDQCDSPCSLEHGPVSSASDVILGELDLKASPLEAEDGVDEADMTMVGDGVSNKVAEMKAALVQTLDDKPIALLVTNDPAENAEVTMDALPTMQELSKMAVAILSTNDTLNLDPSMIVQWRRQYRLWELRHRARPRALVSSRSKDEGLLPSAPVEQSGAGETTALSHASLCSEYAEVGAEASPNDPTPASPAPTLSPWIPCQSPTAASIEDESNKSIPGLPLPCSQSCPGLAQSIQPSEPFVVPTTQSADCALRSPIPSQPASGSALSALFAEDDPPVPRVILPRARVTHMLPAMRLLTEAIQRIKENDAKRALPKEVDVAFAMQFGEVKPAVEGEVLPVKSPRAKARVRGRKRSRRKPVEEPIAAAAGAAKADQGGQ